MQRLSKSGITKHWDGSGEIFRSRYRAWTSVFWDLISDVSHIGVRLEGKQKLSANCTFLLLAKGLNHSLAMLSLAQRGLCVDAALAARNAIETLLLLQVMLLDESENLFQNWIGGKQFGAGWVRKEFEPITPKLVQRGIVIDHQDHDLNKQIYKWLSDITHPNLDSLNHTVRPSGNNSFEVFVGGSLSEPNILNALFAAICRTLLHAAVICLVTFEPDRFEKEAQSWQTLQGRINDAANTLREGLKNPPRTS